MGKSYSYAPGIPLSQNTAKATRITFGISTAHPKPASHCRFLWLLVAAILMHADTSVVPAQAKIILMEKAGKRISATDEVKRIVGVTRNSESISKVPMNLEMGAVLRGKTGAVTVKLICNSATELVLSGPFNVRFLSPQEKGDCNWEDEGKKGSATLVHASGPTHARNGAIRMGTSRTWYRVDNIGSQDIRFLFGGKAAPKVGVFEGPVTIQSKLFSGVLKEGMKLVSGRSCPLTIKKLTRHDFRRAAEVYATLDVSQIADPRDEKAVFRKLVSLHQAVLQAPRDQTKWTALRKAQEELGIPISDAIHSDYQSPPELEVRQDSPSNSPPRKQREFRQRVRKSNQALRRQGRA